MIAQRLFGAICKHRGHRWSEWTHRTYRLPDSPRVWPSSSRMCTRCGEFDRRTSGPLEAS